MSFFQRMWCRQVTWSRLLPSSHLDEHRGISEHTALLAVESRARCAVPVSRSSLSFCTLLLCCSDLHINVVIYFYVSQWNRLPTAHCCYTLTVRMCFLPVLYLSSISFDCIWQQKKNGFILKNPKILSYFTLCLFSELISLWESAQLCCSFP